jgi:hypothetical protein
MKYFKFILKKTDTKMMKKRQFDQLGLYNNLTRLFILLGVIGISFCSSSSSKSSSSSSSTCLVDKCAACPTNKEVLCTACKEGWYLRTFSSGDKAYNACWSISKLILALLSFILLNLMCCGICAACYMIGKRTFTRVPINMQERNNDFGR